MDERALPFAGTTRTRQLHNLIYTAAQMLRVPIAALFLVEGSSYQAKAWVGPVPRTVPRGEGLISRLISTGSVALADVAADARFAAHAQTFGEHPIRSLASTPIRDAHGKNNIGVLCAMDNRQRKFTDVQVGNLLRIAETAHTLLHPRHTDSV